MEQQVSHRTMNTSSFGAGGCTEHTAHTRSGMADVAEGGRGCPLMIYSISVMKQAKSMAK